MFFSGRFNRFPRRGVSGLQQSNYTEESESTSSVLTVHAIQKVPPTQYTVDVNGTPISMEVDWGSCYSFLNSDWSNRLGGLYFAKVQFSNTCRDISYRFSELPTSRYGSVINPSNSASFLSIDLTPLLYSDASGSQNSISFQCIKLNRRLFQHLSRHFSQSSAISSTRLLYPPPIKEFKAHLQIKPNSNLKLFKPRPVPYALRPKVEGELDRLESLGIISKVETAEFSTTPIVPVLKWSSCQAVKLESAATSKYQSISTWTLLSIVYFTSKR